MITKILSSHVLEDGSKNVKEDQTFVSGIALTLDADGDLVTVGSDDVKVYGLAKVDKYPPYSDQVKGVLGYSGPGKAPVIKKGVIEIGPSYFTKKDGSTLKVDVYDATLSTANVNDKLYIKNGLISTNNTQANTYIGTLNRKPSASDETIEIDLDL